MNPLVVPGRGSSHEEWHKYCFKSLKIMIKNPPSKLIIFRFWLSIQSMTLALLSPWGGGMGYFKFHPLAPQALGTAEPLFSQSKNKELQQ